MSSKSPVRPRKISPEEENARLLRKNSFLEDLNLYTRTLTELHQEEAKNKVRRAKLASLEAKLPHLRHLRNAFDNSQYNSSEKEKMKAKKSKKKERSPELPERKANDVPLAALASPKSQKKPKKAVVSSTPGNESTAKQGEEQVSEENINIME